MIVPTSTTIVQSGSNDLTTLATIIGSFVVIVSGFFVIVKLMLNQAQKREEQASKDREADRMERQLLTEAVNKMAESNEKIATATTKQAEESADRNGHLAELVLQGNKLVAKDVQINRGIKTSLEKSAVIAAEDRGSLMQSIQSQNIDEQIVGKQVIKNKEIKK